MLLYNMLLNVIPVQQCDVLRILISLKNNHISYPK